MADADAPTIPLVSSDEPPKAGDAPATDETPLDADPKDAPAVIDTTPVNDAPDAATTAAADAPADAPAGNPAGAPADPPADPPVAKDAKQKEAASGSDKEKSGGQTKKDARKKKKSTNGSGEHKPLKPDDEKKKGPAKGGAKGGAKDGATAGAGGSAGGGSQSDSRRSSRNSDDAENGNGDEDPLLSSERKTNVVYHTIYKVVGSDDSPAKPCFDIFCGTVCCLVLTCMATAVPIAMIVMGALNVNDCPAERFIPIYNIVGGSIGLLSLFIHAAFNLPRFRTKGKKGARSIPYFLTFLNALVGLFSVAWFIAGTIWVYGTRGEWSEKATATDYCDSSLYYFSFWLMTIIYVICGCVLAASLLMCLVTGCMVVCCDK